MKGLVATLILLVAIPSVYAAREYVPLQEKAQGQSLLGANVLNDSLYSNPAGSAFLETYSLSGEFMTPRAFSASVLDTRNQTIGGAVGYFRLPFEGSSTETLQGAKLSLLGRLTDWLAMGVAGKALWGPHLVNQKSDLKDADMGFLLRFDPLSFGLMVRNIFGGNLALDQRREWGVGTRIDWQQSFFLSAATYSTWERFKPYQYGFGAEYVSPYFFSLKGGYRFQPDSRTAYWSTGVSFLAPKISVHYAFEQGTGADHTGEHMVGMNLIF